jgi:hypothetical protein
MLVSILRDWIDLKIIKAEFYPLLEEKQCLAPLSLSMRLHISASKTCLVRIDTK